MTEFFDQQFAKEFKSVMNEMKAETSFSINQLPIPFDKPILTEKLLVKGIKDEKYQQLNNSFVTKRQNKSIKRNIYKNSGEVRSVVDYTAKEGNVLVVTKENLKLPFRYNARDGDLEYVDYRKDKGKRNFIYSVPLKYLYKTQQTVLVASLNPKRGHFGGIQIMLTIGYVIYLYIIPLKGMRKAEGSKPIATKIGVDYGRELKALTEHWSNTGVIFDKNMLELETPINGSYNLGFRVIEPTLEYDKVDEFSMQERSEMKRNQAY